MTLFLITAPSGAGKTTLAQSVSGMRHWRECISTTTRPMRKNEQDGVTYNFVTTQTFEKMDKNEEFAETITYDGNHYGIEKQEIDSKTSQSNSFIIVDFVGYGQVKEIYPDAVGIFLHMSKEDCMANMLLRGDSIESATKRISRYDDEIKNRGHYDYVIKNVRDKQNNMVNLLKNIIYQY